MFPWTMYFFHYEEGEVKWKFGFHIRITRERDLFDEAKKCKDILEILNDAQILKTLMNVGLFYPKLVKELIINFP